MPNSNFDNRFGAVARCRLLSQLAESSGTVVHVDCEDVETDVVAILGQSGREERQTIDGIEEVFVQYITISFDELPNLLPQHHFLVREEQFAIDVIQEPTCRMWEVVLVRYEQSEYSGTGTRR